MDGDEFKRLDQAISLAIDYVITHGGDDIFRQPVFEAPIEDSVIEQNLDEFRKHARNLTIKFVRAGNLSSQRIGHARKSLVLRDHRSYRQVCWLDPFDVIKYLTVAIMVFEKIEGARIPKTRKIIHSHRRSDDPNILFDKNFGYDSFRSAAGELARANVGKWLLTTDISNFFDRIGNHSLENHLLDLGADKRYVTLIREILLFWSGDRRSFGLPVGSAGSRILSEAILLDIDRRLADQKIQFVRYVDDYRFVAETQGEAYSILRSMTEMLAEEGLSLNPSKTNLHLILEDYQPPAQGIATFEEHSSIDETEVKATTVPVRVSGRTSYSKKFERPGQAALAKLKKLTKEDVLSQFHNANDSEFESIVRLLVKFFIYVDQDTEILKILIGRRKTTIFYICDALLKDAERFSEEKRIEITVCLSAIEKWKTAAYPYQIPIIRLFSSPEFRQPKLIGDIFDRVRLDDNMVFFREFLRIASGTLDRMRIRRLASEHFVSVPDFVQRAIFLGVSRHPTLSEDEKRPLIKNMKQATDDWFIARSEIENEQAEGG